MDIILEQLSVFWSNTEVLLDLLSKKGQHAEQFISFSRNPKLLARFRERLGEYRSITFIFALNTSRKFWEGVMSMCHAYFMGMVEQEDTLTRFATPPEEILSSSSSFTSISSPISSQGFH